MGFIYKNYLLKSKSVQISESDRWTVEATIGRNKGSEGEAGEQTVSSEKTFSSKEVADMEGIIFARKVIDGEITGLSIDDRN